MMGGGVALFDCDNDGKLDIVSVTDSTVETYLHGGELMLRLYHQDTAPGAAPHFTDITARAGLTTLGWGMGLAIADFDNDGLPDIYVTGYGHNVLYRNLGGCRFEDVTAKYNLAGSGFSVGAAWPTTTATATSTSSSLATSTPISTIFPGPETNPSTIKVFRSKSRFKMAKPTCSSTRTKKVPSTNSRTQRESRTLTSASAWASSGPTTTMTAGPTSSSPMTWDRTSSITTSTTEPLRSSA